MAKGLIEGGSNFLRDTLTAEVSKTFQTMLQNTQQQSMLDAQLNAAKENKKLEIDTNLLSNAMVNAQSDPDSTLTLLDGYMKDPQMSDDVRPVIESNINLVKSIISRKEEIEKKYNIYKNMPITNNTERKAKEDYKRTHLMPHTKSAVPIIATTITSLLENDFTQEQDMRKRTIDVFSPILEFTKDEINSLSEFAKIDNLNDDQFTNIFQQFITTKLSRLKTQDEQDTFIRNFVSSKAGMDILADATNPLFVTLSNYLETEINNITGTSVGGKGGEGGGLFYNTFNLDKEEFPGFVKMIEEQNLGISLDSVPSNELLKNVETILGDENAPEEIKKEATNLKARLLNLNIDEQEDEKEVKVPKPTGETGFSISQVDVKGSGRRSGEREMVRLRGEGKGVLGEKNNKINIIEYRENGELKEIKLSGKSKTIINNILAGESPDDKKRLGGRSGGMEAQKNILFRELKSSNKDLNITEEQVNTLLNTITGNIEDLETTETPTEVETPDETPTEQPDTGDISIESLFEDSIKALNVRNNIGEIELSNTPEYVRNIRTQIDDVQKKSKNKEITPQETSIYLSILGELFRQVKDLDANTSQLADIPMIENAIRRSLQTQ
jgi:hypothetical protein